MIVFIMITLSGISLAGDDAKLMNPSESYIIECLEKVDLVVAYGAVTKDNDPNRKLNEPDGYTSCVYFASSLLGWSADDYSPKSVVNAGTDVGGCIEVYRTVNDAVKRKEYLDSWGSLAGYSVVKGSVVIRTSGKLEGEDQKTLEQAVVTALTGEEVAKDLEAAPAAGATDVRQLLFDKYNGFTSIHAMSTFMTISGSTTVGYLANNGTIPTGAGVAETANKAGSYVFSYYIDPNTQELHVYRITLNAIAENSDDTFLIAASFLAELSVLGIIPDSDSSDFENTISKILIAADASQSIMINDVKIYFVTASVDGKAFLFASAEGFDL